MIFQCVTSLTCMISNSYFPQRCLQTADELKTEGNEHFRGQRWNEALAQYRSALGQLPRRKEKMRPDPPPLDELNSGSDKGKEKAKDEELEDVDPTSAECAKARAILNANIGACFVKLVTRRYPYVPRPPTIY